MPAKRSSPVERRALCEETRLIGRGAELARLAEHLDRGVSLVTIVGPAGVGKTALARELLRRHRSEPGDGAVASALCDLTDAVDVQTLCEAVAKTLAVPHAADVASASIVEMLGRVLQGRGPLLLVLDNVEQLVEEAAPAIAHWLEQSPELTFVVTSRERLRIETEILIELEPLSLPASNDELESSEAAILWVERVRALQPDYRVVASQSATIRELLWALDGLPLAIELAAARSRLMVPAELLRRLKQRFELLSVGRRGPSRRHATLESAIDSSWELLTVWEQAALAQCAVFRGGFSVTAAEAVLDVTEFRDAPDVMAILQSLRDKSLLRLDQTADGNDSRLGLLLTIRDYAQAKLAAVDGEVHAFRRHASFFAAWAEALAAEAEHSGKSAVLRTIASEHENLLVAVDRCLSAGDRETALRILVAMDHWAGTHGRYAAVAARLKQALGQRTTESTGVSPLVLARALVMLGHFRSRIGELADGRADAEMAAQLARQVGSPSTEVSALRVLARIFAFNPTEGSLDAVAESAKDVLGRARDEKDRWVPGHAWLILALAEHRRGRLPTAREYCNQAVTLLAGHDIYEFIAISVLGGINLEADDVEGGIACAERAAQKNEAIRIRSPGFEGRIPPYLGPLLLSAGRLSEARDCLQTGCEIARRDGLGEKEAEMRAALALVYWSQGDLENARAELFDALPLIERFSGTIYGPVYRLIFGALEAATGRLEAARHMVDRAEADLAVAGDCPERAVARMSRAHLDFAAAGRARKLGENGEAERLQGAARQALLDAGAPTGHGADAQPPATSRSFETRMLARLLDAAMTRGEWRPATPRPPRSLLIDAEARWFQVSGRERIRCSHRPVLRRVTLLLVRAHQERRGRPVPREEVLEAGWPGERMLPGAAKNRLHVMITRIRDLGFRDVLCATDEGYFLDPDVAVEVVASSCPV